MDVERALKEASNLIVLESGMAGTPCRVMVPRTARFVTSKECNRNEFIFEPKQWELETVFKKRERKKNDSLTRFPVEGLASFYDWVGRCSDAALDNVLDDCDVVFQSETSW